MLAYIFSILYDPDMALWVKVGVGPEHNVCDSIKRLRGKKESTGIANCIFEEESTVLIRQPRYILFHSKEVQGCQKEPKGSAK